MSGLLLFDGSKRREFLIKKNDIINSKMSPIKFSKFYGIIYYISKVYKFFKSLFSNNFIIKYWYK
jgi:hypothetical protein